MYNKIQKIDFFSPLQNLTDFLTDTSHNPFDAFASHNLSFHELIPKIFKFKLKPIKPLFDNKEYKTEKENLKHTLFPPLISKKDIIKNQSYGTDKGIAYEKFRYSHL